MLKEKNYVMYWNKSDSGLRHGIPGSTPALNECLWGNTFET